jgi:sugar lactone lactonase YvrE
MIKKFLLAALAACWAMPQGFPAGFRIDSFDRLGHVSWTNGPASGIVTVETAADPAGPWRPHCNFFSTNASGQATLPPPTNQTFYRLLAVDITPDQNGFGNLVYAYGIIETIAGKGEFATDGLNNWLPDYEGGPATNANLSRPHFSVADRAGNIYIADKNSNAILMVTPDGNIHTVAGTHVAGDTGDGPDFATSLELNHPNGEYLKDDGTLYIMDTNNHKIRRLDTNGIMSTIIFIDPHYSLGRGLWVSDDETLAYIAASTTLLKWTPDNGVEVASQGWGELGTLLVDPSGNVLLTDRLGDSVWLMTPDGSATRFAGNGTTAPIIDGTPALEVGLYCVRGIWPFSTGGYLYAMECGSQIAYQDAGGYVYVLVDGQQGNIHLGDGEWFYTPGPKVSNCRSVTMDYRGNILITENDAGYVRRVRFQRLQP